MGAQAVPVGGVLVLAWPAAGGLVLYWIESVLVLGATALLLALFVRRTRASGNAADLAGLAAAGIRPRDVLLVQGGALGIFGLFFGGFLFILVANGHIASAGLQRALAGVPVLAGIVALGLVFDLVRLPRLTLVEMTSRVNAGVRRSAIFWFVGFFGALGATFFGKPLLLFGLFAGIKTLFEIGAVLERQPVKL